MHGLKDQTSFMAHMQRQHGLHFTHLRAQAATAGSSPRMDALLSDSSYSTTSSTALRRPKPHYYSSLLCLHLPTDPRMDVFHKKGHCSHIFRHKLITDHKLQCLPQSNRKTKKKIDWFSTTAMSMFCILHCLYILTQQHTPARAAGTAAGVRVLPNIRAKGRHLALYSVDLR